MNQELKKILQDIYVDHDLKESDLDYRVAESYIANFDRVSLLSRGCFFIMDIHKIDYIYTSDGFKSLFGYVPRLKVRLIACCICCRQV